MSHGSDYKNESPLDAARLVSDLREWGRSLGFQKIGISDIDLAADERRLEAWLADGRHGEMEWMARHGHKRSRPEQLVPGTRSVIVARMDYLPESATDPLELAERGDRACISRYALGRDYHKILRARLKSLAGRIEERIGPFGYRVFTDSAPVLEKPLAAKAGLGWIGKHTNLLDRHAGSWFFLGEIYTDLALPADEPVRDHCGSCRRCIDVCPTDAITAPYQLDARRCISYLTIELKGAIPVEFRRAIGNRVYGCDDCQAVCPWNRYADFTGERDFTPREGLDAPKLVDLFAWSEQEFLDRTRGSAIRRIGHERWLRNLAVGLGNAPTSPEVLEALRARADHPSALVREHVAWALAQHGVPGRGKGNGKRGAETRGA
ncbi:tRNA epoxyqueuosine(34) reductase QueG [Halomonas denitrificans]|nr:tRNA epoxyqueuosine(34) reductase QueG [Halomonas denitrificans]